MEELKYGDIRKIVNHGKEFVGVYLGLRQGNMVFVTDFGELIKINERLAKITSISAVRLKPEVRKVFSNIVGVHTKQLKLEKEIESLGVMRYKLNDEFLANVNMVSKVQGIYNIIQFKKELSNKLVLDRNGALTHGYRVDTPQGITSSDRVAFVREEFIRANPGSYDFYVRWADGSTEIIEESESYKKFIAKMKTRDCNFSGLKETKDYKFKEHRSLEDCDKGIMYTHQVVIEFKTKGLTDEIIDSLVKRLR